MFNLNKQLLKQGFFYVEAGFDLKQQGRIMDAGRRLFQVKDQPLVSNKGFTRGYIGYGKESGSEQFEHKQAFSYGMHIPDPTNELEGRNEWSKEYAMQDRHLLMEFYHHTFQVFANVCRDLSGIVGHDLHKDTIGGERISMMRVFDYPPMDGALGSSPHTDWGFLTLILADERQPGLEHFDNGWHKIPARIKDDQAYYVVNAGDYLSSAFSDITSPLHRVVGTQDPRLSFVFFGYPRFDMPLPPRNERVSLFQDQSLSNQVISSTSFGEYISAKWTSVAR
ncbi:hypothetical protein EDD86DRAFT_209241 [Gorgonomyces haynaldii]|nr:hypothetical protein EDD86DRAFT_209241 [Gorgonomyces haynaldii]